MVDPLEGVNAKFNRARHHLQCLKAEEARFFEEGAYALRIEEGYPEHLRNLIAQNPRPEDRIIDFSVYVDWVKEPPIATRLIAGDAIQNTRAALDHLAWQLVLANHGQPDRHTAFPILVPTRTNKGKIRKASVSGGIDPQALALIESFQPNDRPEHPLFRLHQLSNTDKHRLLLVAATSVNDVIRWIGPHMSSSASSAGHHIPLKPGAYLGSTGVIITSYDPSMEVKAEATVRVAFGEGETCEYLVIIDVLTELISYTSSLVDRLTTFL